MIVHQVHSVHPTSSRRNRNQNQQSYHPLASCLGVLHVGWSRGIRGDGSQLLLSQLGLRIRRRKFGISPVSWGYRLPLFHPLGMISLRFLKYV